MHAGNSGKLLEAPQEIINKFRHISEPNRRTYAGKKILADYKLGGVSYKHFRFIVYWEMLY